MPSPLRSSRVAALLPGLLCLALAGAAAANPAAPMSAGAFTADAGALEGRVRLVVGAGSGAETVLELERFAVWAADATLVRVDPDGVARPLEQPRDVYFRGHVGGEPVSRAFVSVDPEGRLFGLVDRGLRREVVVADATGARLAPLEIADDPRRFACAQASLPPPPPEAAPAAAVDPTPAAGGGVDAAAVAGLRPKGALWRARVAIDSDFEFFQRFSNAAAATTYVGNLIGYMSTIYVDQLDTELQVNYLRLWNTSADPWAQTSALCGLYEFGKHWNDNFTGQPRTIAHFFSGKNAGGGVAWLGVLCGTAFNHDASDGNCQAPITGTGNYGGAYGWTGNLTGSFNPSNPTAVWDIFATAHEIGHNFFSPHTHCYANIGGNPAHVDECYSGEGGSCFSGTPSLPGPQGQGAGTIMSYCHLRPGGFGNIALNFGRNHAYGVAPVRVADRMRAHVQARATASPACLAIANDPAPGAPVASAATNVGANAFTANWSHPAGATNFQLDVSTSPGFAGFVPGYQSLVVGAVRSHAVTGLSGSGPWYYRVRATGPGGTSANSNVIQVGSAPTDLLFADGFGP